MTEPDAAQKYQNLLIAIKNLKSLIIAFSGGVDSTFLLAAAKEASVDRILAVTSASPIHMKREIENAFATMRRPSRVRGGNTEMRL